MLIHPGISFGFALVASVILTPIVKKISQKTGYVSTPQKDRWHTKTTALLGGISIYVAFVISLLLFSGLNNIALNLLVGGSIIFIIGLIDDLKRIKPKYKLLGQILAAVVLIYLGVSAGIFSNQIFNIAFSLFWLVALANAFNLLDNMDGLTAGVAAISSFALGAYAYMTAQPSLGLICLLMAGSLLGFLCYNFNPAKIFMGDSGSLFIGFMIGALSLQIVWMKPSENILLNLTPFLFAAVPLFDTTFVTVMRILHGRKISQGGKDHTSHRLTHYGLSEKSVAFILYSISMICCLGALSWFYVSTTLSYLFLVIIITLFVFITYFLVKIKVYQNKN
ncbi:undecaprenyl/decaprenyl-phosphate alpha-N-acetylglucosaminyl 1-phosphate transferase [Candidatus Kuenenbacteria bacterium]|nr:undecaprenyl/decaprenyl-phosphate alpha-N-acetylglucosaminyl 1-phosphate transferase [Candidatus Kuenenbacteria bacterium]